MTFKDAAGAYIQAGWLCIPVKGKSVPPAGVTGRAGSIDSNAIFAYTLDPFWAAQNLAVRSDGSWITIDVDDYDDKHGAEDLAELEAKYGPLPATYSSTSRGQDSPSRQYFFAVPDPTTEFRSKPADSIEVVQHSHRFAVAWPSIHPDTKQQYAWYDQDGHLMAGPPNLEDLEYLPEAWLEFLSVKAPVAAVAGAPSAPEGFDGNISAWLGILPAGEPSERVERLIGDIPAEDFGHDVLVKLIYRLVRLGAENEPGVEAALVHLRAEWLRGLYDTPENRADFTAAVDGAIKKAGALEEPLPPPLTEMDWIGLYERRQADITTVIRQYPEFPTDVGLAEARRSIAAAAWSAGFSDSEVLSILTRSRAGIEYIDASPSGVRGLWREALLHRTAPQGLTAIVTPQATKTLAPTAKTTGPMPADFLTPEEHAIVRETKWWGTRYLHYAQTHVRAFNEQYHRLMLWTILSLYFGPIAAIPIESGHLNLNIFGLNLGPTTSGKSEAARLGRRVIRRLWPDDSPDIGGDASREALTTVLLDRDNKSSWLNRDEVHALFKEMRRPGSWQSAIRAHWTELYDCEVRQIHRKTDAEHSGRDATSYFTMMLTGTEEGMIDALEDDYWTSGFMARFVVAIGGRVESTPEMSRIRIRRGPMANSIDEFPAQLAAELEAAYARLGLRVRRDMDMDEAAEERYNEFAFEMDRIVAKSKHFERTKPTSIRFRDNIVKCAALAALSDGEPIIQLEHMLIAIDQAGQWWGNLVYLIEQTDSSEVSRRAKKLAAMVAAEPGARMLLTELHSVWGGAKRDTEDLIAQLKAEGRAVIDGNYITVRGDT